MTLSLSSVVAAADTPPAVGAAPTVDTAMKLAVKQRQRVEVTGLDDERSTTYANPNGTLSDAISNQPIRVRRAGSLVSIDTTLAVNADGSVSPKAVPQDVKIGGGGTTALVSLTIGGSRISYSWSAPLPKPSLSGATATFAEVRPGQDLTVVVSTAGVETFLVLKRKPAAGETINLDLPVTISGGTVASDSQGNTTFADTAGHVLATSAAPAAWDASRDARTDEPRTTPVISTFTRPAHGARPSGQGGPEVTTVQSATVASSFLTDPTTVYPVTIDPPTTMTSYEYNYLDSSYPNSSHVNDPWDTSRGHPGGQVHVGNEPGSSGKDRAMYGFTSSIALQGRTILSATLGSIETWAWNCTAQPVGVYSTAGWGAGTDWANFNGQGTYTGASINAAHGYTGCADGTVNWDVTSSVIGTINGGANSFYLQLRAGDEGNPQQWKKFDTKATLVITYDTAPYAPSNLNMTVNNGPNQGCVVGAARPVLRASAASPLRLVAQQADPDGDSVSTSFYWYGPSNGNASAGYQGAGDVSVLAGSGGSLPDGTYYFNTVTTDGTLSSAVSNYCEFTVLNTPPPAPSVTSSSFDLSLASRKGAYLVPGQIDLSDARSTYLSKYVYALNQGTTPPNTPPACEASAGGFSSECSFAATDASATVAVTPTSSTDTFSVWAVDVAGNVSVPTTKTFAVASVMADNARHAWIERDGQSATSVPDLAGASASSLLTWTTGVTRLSSPFSATLGGPSNSSGPRNYNDALQFDGVTGQASTGALGMDIDASHSFTVAAWVNTIYARAQTAVSIDGTVGGTSRSVATLGVNAAGLAQFCMATTTAAMNCVADSSTNGPNVVNNGWTFISGAWDALTKTGQISVYIPGNVSPFTDAQVTSASFTTVTSSVGALTLGRGLSSGAATQRWTGGIADPLVWDNVVQTAQLDALYSDLPVGVANGQVTTPPSAVQLDQLAGSYIPLRPSRIVDTRYAVGASAAQIASQSQLDIRPNGSGGLPADGVEAAVLNVTVANPTGTGPVTVFGNINNPNYSSLNVTPGSTVSNTVIAPVDGSGMIHIFNGTNGALDLVIDVTGYYVSGTPTAKGSYSTVVPARAGDTRNTVGPILQGKTLSVLLAGYDGIPSNATAVAVNVTVTSPTSDGYVTAYAHGAAFPSTSSLDFTSGQTVANLVVSPLGSDGKLAIYSGAQSVQLIIDVVGYFVGGTVSFPTGVHGFAPVSPTRIINSSTNTGIAGPLASNASTTYTVASPVPSTASAVMINFVAVTPTAAGYLSMYPYGSARPSTSDLAYVVNAQMAQASVVKLITGKFTITNNSPGTVQVVGDVVGYYF